MLYFFLALAASFFGAFCGLGGGVVIKPALDAFTDLAPNVISILSAFCVLTIALTSVIKYVLSRTPFDVKRCLLLGGGSVVGGFVGTKLLDMILAHAPGDTVVFVQSVILFSLLCAAVVYMTFFKEKGSFRLSHPLAVLAAGLGLGMASAFLSVGGGPINVALFVLLFSVTVKEAAVSSLVVILVSQVTKLLTLTTTGGLSDVDLTPLLILLPVAFVGALIGAALNRRAPDKLVLTVYNASVVGIAAISLYNAIVVLL